MNKTELVAAIAEKAELSKKDAEKALKVFTETVAEQLKNGDKIQLVGFGTFEVAERAARTGQNPRRQVRLLKFLLLRHLSLRLVRFLKDTVNSAK